MRQSRFSEAQIIGIVQEAECLALTKDPLGAICLALRRLRCPWALLRCQLAKTVV